jgi:hypothetical protein
MPLDTALCDIISRANQDGMYRSLAGAKPPHHLRKRTVDEDRTMWSAVALQQHITRNLMHEGRLGNAPKPSMQKEGTLSLAQRMGLAPQPPPAPAEPEWQQAEAMSRYRHDALGNCAICCETLVARGGQCEKRSLVIASCSHVFHEACLTQTERFRRRANYRKQCPVCRREGYYTKPYNAGAAQVQKHAVTKLQAWARGLAARRQYVAERLKRNSGFRSEYYYSKLRRYADVTLAQAEMREKSVDALLAEIDLRQAMARLLTLAPEDWLTIQHTAVSKRLTASNEHSDGGAEGAPCAECPICLATVAVAAAPVQGVNQPPAGSGFRLVRGHVATPPEAILPTAPAPSAGRGNGIRGQKAKSTPRDAIGRGKPTVKPAAQAPPPQAHAAVRQPMRVVMDAPSAPMPLPVAVGRAAVVTSCSHVFHAQCLKSFEQFAGVSSVEPDLTASDAAVPKCPVCRAAYLSRAFFL